VRRGDACSTGQRRDTSRYEAGPKSTRIPNTFPQDQCHISRMSSPRIAPRLSRRGVFVRHRVRRTHDASDGQEIICALGQTRETLPQPHMSTAISRTRRAIGSSAASIQGFIWRDSSSVCALFAEEHRCDGATVDAEAVNGQRAEPDPTAGAFRLRESKRRWADSTSLW
jgi:hypothetical protein